MPSLKVRDDGVWKKISTGGNGSNADTLDGMHASDFALAADLEDYATKKYLEDYATKEYHDNSVTTLYKAVLSLVGNTSVSDQIKEKLKGYATEEYVGEQIDEALADFSSGKTLTEHLKEEDMVLSSRQYGDTLPDPGVPGRIFFKRVIE